MIIAPDRLDQAALAGTLELSPRVNRRPVRCCNAACRANIGRHQGRQLWVDGVKVGYLGPECYVGLTVQSDWVKQTAPGGSGDSLGKGS